MAPSSGSPEVALQESWAFVFHVKHVWAAGHLDDDDHRARFTVLVSTLSGSRLADHRTLPRRASTEASRSHTAYFRPERVTVSGRLGQLDAHATQRPAAERVHSGLE